MTTPAGENTPDPAAAWHAFLNLPSTYIHQGKLFAMFGGTVNMELCRRLAAEPRLQQRLSTLIEEHYGLATLEKDSCSAEDRAIATLSLKDMQSLVRRAGAIYWSTAIAALVLAPEIMALYEVLGEPLCVGVVAHRDLAGPVQSLAPFTTLGQRVDADGWRCLAAWCAEQPLSISARVQLKWPQTIVPDDDAIRPLLHLGPAIIRRAMTITV